MAELVWPLTVLIIAGAVIAVLARPARRALTLWGDTFAKSAAERDAAAVKLGADTEEKRCSLAVRRGAIEQETAREQARLAAEAAQYETDAEAARQCLPAAVEARQAALRARGEAEAAIAPEAARSALEGTSLADAEWLGAVYSDYTRRMTYSSDILPFGEWVKGFEGARRDR